jgi:5-amino-6-(5-phosphoribosylamino)uracil reductase
VRSLLPPGLSDAADADLLAGYAYPRLERDRWWLRANMVSSLDGAVTGADGRSGTLSTPPDRRVFHHLRSLADAVVVGAGTARAENYGPVRAVEAQAAAREARGQPARAAMVVVTRSLALDPHARLFSGPDRVVVVTTRSAPWDAVERLAEVADVVRTGGDEVDLAEMLALLAARGLRRLLCEGGPALLGHLVAARLVDELCLTVAPLMVAGQVRRIADGPGAEPPVGFSPAGMLLADDGTLLTRWRRG